MDLTAQHAEHRKTLAYVRSLNGARQAAKRQMTGRTEAAWRALYLCRTGVWSLRRTVRALVTGA